MKLEDFKKFSSAIAVITYFIIERKLEDKNLEFYYFLQYHYSKAGNERKMTYILSDSETVHVFFGDKYAYTVPRNRLVEQAIYDEKMASIKRYREAYIDNPDLRQLNLEQLMQKLKKQPKGNKVMFDFNDKICPTEFESYRGIYKDLALDYKVVPDNYGMTVAELYHEAETSCNRHFVGYKGGDFYMNEDTVIWISPYGQSSGRMLIDIVERDGKTILITEE
jgi:hypothetical protein